MLHRDLKSKCQLEEMNSWIPLNSLYIFFRVSSDPWGRWMHKTIQIYELKLSLKSWIMSNFACQLKAHCHRSKAEAKAKIFFYVCRLFFDLSRFRSHFLFVWICPYTGVVEASWLLSSAFDETVVEKSGTLSTTSLLISGRNWYKVFWTAVTAYTGGIDGAPFGHASSLAKSSEESKRIFDSISVLNLTEIGQNYVVEVGLIPFNFHLVSSMSLYFKNI